MEKEWEKGGRAHIVFLRESDIHSVILINNYVTPTNAQYLLNMMH
jgi:hypothetical protein